MWQRTIYKKLSEGEPVKKTKISVVPKINESEYGPPCLITKRCLKVSSAILVRKANFEKIYFLSGARTLKNLLDPKKFGKNLIGDNDREPILICSLKNLEKEGIAVADLIVQKETLDPKAEKEYLVYDDIFQPCYLDEGKKNLKVTRSPVSPFQEADKNNDKEKKTYNLVLTTEKKVLEAKLGEKACLAIVLKEKKIAPEKFKKLEKNAQEPLLRAAREKYNRVWQKKEFPEPLPRASENFSDNFEPDQFDQPLDAVRRNSFCDRLVSCFNRARVNFIRSANNCINNDCMTKLVTEAWCPGMCFGSDGDIALYIAQWASVIGPGMTFGGCILTCILLLVNAGIYLLCGNNLPVFGGVTIALQTLIGPLVYCYVLGGICMTCTFPIVCCFTTFFMTLFKLYKLLGRIIMPRQRVSNLSQHVPPQNLRVSNLNTNVQTSSLNPEKQPLLKKTNERVNQNKSGNQNKPDKQNKSVDPGQSGKSDGLDKTCNM